MEQEVKQNHLSPDKYSPLKAELKLKEHSKVSPKYIKPNLMNRFPSPRDVKAENREGPSPLAPYKCKAAFEFTSPLPARTVFGRDEQVTFSEVITRQNCSPGPQKNHYPIEKLDLLHIPSSAGRHRLN